MRSSRWCLAAAVAVILSAGCASVARQPASRSRGIDIGGTAATRIAEQLAIQDSHGDPVLTRPSDARSMALDQAERAIGSSEDFSLGASAPVWLVHVYADVAGRRGSPPRPPWAPTTTTPVTRSTVPPNYFVIIDAATGRVVVENY
jgi:hypothetical protein